MSANRGSRTPIAQTRKRAPTVIMNGMTVQEPGAASVYHLVGGFVVTDADLKQT